MAEITSTPDQTQPQKKRTRFRTLFALSFGYFIDQGEAQAMSVFFPVLQRIWGLSYTQLGWIGTIRSLLQAITAPLWGFAADKFPRKNVIVFGTGIWGIWTLLVGFSQDFGQLLTIRAISGIGLGCLLPATFSLMADTFPPKQRGRALGIMGGIGVLGIVVGVLGLGLLATEELWRWGFFILGGFSIISGLVVWFLVDEPVRGSSEPELSGKITAEDAAQYNFKFSDVPLVLKIPTVWVAIAQGLAGSMPWVVMGLFLITWLVNDRNLEANDATIAFAGIVVGTAISNVIGGFLGDWAEGVSPKYGRTFIGQISVIIGIPLTYILFTQTADWSLAAITALAFFTALLISWPGRGAKEPMMQAVTPPELRSTAFAFVTFIESGFAAIIALVAGNLADETSLTEALIWTVPFPWILCAIIFTFFYWTYPRDSMKLRSQMAERADEIS